LAAEIKARDAFTSGQRSKHGGASMTKIIALTQGKETIVDDEDFEHLNQWKWNCNKYGYAVRTIPKTNGKNMWMHREIMNTPAGFQTDHINGNKRDNRRENLRICTASENRANNPLRMDNTSGFKGVSWDIVHEKWNAKLAFQGRRINLGFFSSAIEAAQVYDKALRKFFGDFARVNFIDNGTESLGMRHDPASGKDVRAWELVKKEG
jgi:hypothetical protein